MSKLGVNIDHVATLRQARREVEPDPIEAARICEGAGCHSIVAHLREDRRHINEKDIKELRGIIKTKFNLEMSLNQEIVKIASMIKPDQATLVPEKRQEVTTEGGLDVISHFHRIKKTIRNLKDNGIQVSLFIDPVKKQIEKSKEVGADAIELHTGQYARMKTQKTLQRELNQLKKMTQFAKNLQLVVHAGHGLKYCNAEAVARIHDIEELNIGHSIISYAVFVGLEKAVKEMLSLVKVK